MKAKIRSLFIAPPGKLLLAVDFSQGETWITAHLANEQTMIQYLKTSDVHTETANFLFHPEIKCEHDWMKAGKGAICTICELNIIETERYIGKQNNHANCVDDKTEVLTENGWKSIALLQIGEKIAQWDEDRKITFQEPIHLIKQPHLGKMYLFKGKEYNQFVTGNHKIPYIKTSKRVSTFDAEAYKQNFSARLPINGYYSGERNLDSNIIKLAVAIQADATFLGPKTVFHFRKTRKIVRCREILKALNINYKETEAANGTTYLRFYHCQPALELLKDKKFNLNALLELSASNLDTFIEELREWDGTWHGAITQYLSHDLSNLDVVNTLLYLRGKQGINSKFGYLSINNRQTCRMWSCYEHDFDGYVYCVTMPSGYFLMRRDGKISVTHNSYGMGAERQAQVINKRSDLPPFVVVSIKQCKGYQEAWHGLYPNIHNWHMEVQRELISKRTLITPYGFRRRFYEHMNDQLFKAAYAFIPQSTLLDHCSGKLQPGNEIPGGLRVVKQTFVDKYPNDFKIINMSHDSFCMEVPEKQVEEVGESCMKIMQRPMIVNGMEFTIPVDAEFGINYGEMESL